MASRDKVSNLTNIVRIIRSNTSSLVFITLFLSHNPILIILSKEWGLSFTFLIVALNDYRQHFNVLIFCLPMAWYVINARLFFSNLPPLTLMQEMRLSAMKRDIDIDAEISAKSVSKHDTLSDIFNQPDTDSSQYAAPPSSHTSPHLAALHSMITPGIVVSEDRGTRRVGEFISIVSTVVSCKIF